MTDRDIEMKLKAAVDHTAPDGLARLLSDVENGKGAVTMTKTNNKRRNRWIGLVAACLALVLIAGRRGGKPGLTVGPCLTLTAPGGGPTDEIRQIYHMREE